MVAARLVAHARQQAGMSQRALARKAGVPHSTVARIELGRLAPRADTLERLLRAAGSTLSTEPTLGEGIDRTQIRELLGLTTSQRARLANSDEAAAVQGRDARDADAMMRAVRTTVTLDPEALEVIQRLMKERGLTFKQAINLAITSKARRGSSKRAFRTPTFDMGSPQIPIESALRLAGELEDEELMRRLAARK